MWYKLAALKRVDIYLKSGCVTITHLITVVQCLNNKHFTDDQILILQELNSWVFLMIKLRERVWYSFLYMKLHLGFNFGTTADFDFEFCINGGEI